MEAVEQHKMDLRFFEIIFMICLLEFRNNAVKYAVLESGIGGRQDCTNIIHRPVCTAITSVGFDHCEILGDTLDLIASEKAGIIKPGVPCVIGPTCLERSPIYEQAAALGSEIIGVDTMGSEDFTAINNKIAFEVVKQIQKKDTTLMKLEDSKIKQKIDDSNQPCRFEKVPGKNIYLDVAHNEQGISAVLNQIDCKFPNIKSIRFVFALSLNKDFQKMVTIMEQHPKLHHIHLVSTCHPRLTNSIKAYDLMKPHSSKLMPLESPGSDSNIKETLDLIHRVQSTDELVLVCGSFFIMADVRRYFGLEGTETD